MLKKIIKIIEENKRFLITAHINLEGDALGSTLAVYGMLRQLKKKPLIFLNDPVPSQYNFLPYTKSVKNEIGNNKIDVAIVLDCSDSFRTGVVKDYLGRARYIINIDHHISNTYFGDLNWVRPNASSAAEMVYKLAKKMGVINKNIARCIYTGVATDTGNFTYANASAQAHKTVAELLKYHIKPDKIHQKIHSCCVGKDLKLIGRIMSSLKFTPNRKVCWVTIKRWPAMDFDLSEIIFSIMKLLKETDVFILFKKITKKQTRVNFRSRSKVDVNRVAKFFGGGGHKRASGTTVNDSLEVTEKKVISFIRRYTNGKKKK